MAEAEVQKHTKKIFNIMSDKQNAFWVKTREFLVEIITIVFAISLSIWFHERSEHNHQQKEVKEFLIGLREDLISDQKEFELDKDSYKNQQKFFYYLSQLKPSTEVSIDSIQKYSNQIFNIVGLVQNNGRFEGFKASGKIGLIENKKLQNTIMDLYQESIPLLLTSTDIYSTKKNQLILLIEKNSGRLPTGEHKIGSALMMDESQFISLELASFAEEIIKNYDKCKDKSNLILSEIEQEIKE